MISRETPAQLVAVCLAMAIMLWALLTFGDGTNPVTTLLVLVLVYGIGLGGAHLYYAVRNVDGDVPVGTRWRYLGFVLLYSASMVVAVRVGMDERIVDLPFVGGVLGWIPVGRDAVGDLVVAQVAGLVVLAVFVAYFLYEARSGYREFVA